MIIPNGLPHIDEQQTAEKDCVERNSNPETINANNDKIGVNRNVKSNVLVNIDNESDVGRCCKEVEPEENKCDIDTESNETKSITNYENLNDCTKVAVIETKSISVSSTDKARKVSEDELPADLSEGASDHRDVRVETGDERVTKITEAGQEETASPVTEVDPLITSDAVGDNDISGSRQKHLADKFLPPSGPETIILYRRRWYILLVLSLCVSLQNAVWGTWGPIAESAMFVYGWDTKMVFIIINCGNIGVLLPALFTGHMISTKGLRVSMIVCSLLLAVGSGLRTISRHATSGTILVGAGQFFNGMAGSITQVIPAALSETWFPVHERATATAIGVISNSVGSIAAFMLGPNIVQEPSITRPGFHMPNVSVQNAGGDNITSPYSEEASTISDQIWVLTMIEFGIGVALFLLTVAYFPAKPPSPPSRSATEERVKLFEGLMKVLRQPLILLVALSCAVPWAVYGNWMGLLNLNLHEIGISQSQSGLFGFYASIAGVIGGILIGRVADRFLRRLKLFVIIVFFLALLVIIWITLMRNGYLPRSIASFAMSISLLGVMMNAALPLCYEMTCECGYPIHEGIIGTFISLEINAAAVIFLLVKFIPNIGVIWMNWTFVGVLASSIIFLLTIRERYLRTDVDYRLEIIVDPEINTPEINTPLA